MCQKRRLDGVVLDTMAASGSVLIAYIPVGAGVATNSGDSTSTSQGFSTWGPVLGLQITSANAEGVTHKSARMELVKEEVFIVVVIWFTLLLLKESKK